MDGTDSDIVMPQPTTPETNAGAECGLRSDAVEELTLLDLVAQLEQDPGECLRAYHGLESIEHETRLRIIEGLAPSAGGPGVAALLQLLATSGNEAMRTAALIALGEPLHVEEPAGPGPGSPLGWCGAEPARELVRAGDLLRPRLVHCLVTGVDGAGRGSIALSTSQGGFRSTAVFLCDVQDGITDAIGQLEEESPEAGGLLCEVRDQVGGPGALDVPDLAIGLLAGSFMLSAESTSSAVAEWLERTLGPNFQPRPLTVPGGDWAGEPMTSAELRTRADEILDACPDWLDRSPLTFELAEELFLREGRIEPDSERDSGAFRFLFEHRIIHRMECYRRMLLWMAWFWGAGGEQDLARSAQVLAWQLSDEQYAVPSHPFAVALTARSLDAAQAQFGTAVDPRAERRQI